MKHPLGLPRGSVRALLALFVVFVTCWLTVKIGPGEEIPVAVSEALFTVLAYYFATRAHATMSRAELEELLAERGGETEKNPLFLPTGTIRVLIILAFLGLAGYLVKAEGTERLLSATTLVLVLAFFAGQGLKHLRKWLRRNKPRKEAGAFEHLKAGVGVAVGIAFVWLYVSGHYTSAPPQTHKLFLGFIIFYFGSR